MLPECGQRSNKLIIFGKFGEVKILRTQNKAEIINQMAEITLLLGHGMSNCRKGAIKIWQVSANNCVSTPPMITTNFCVYVSFGPAISVDFGCNCWLRSGPVWNWVNRPENTSLSKLTPDWMRVDSLWNSVSLTSVTVMYKWNVREHAKREENIVK